MKISRKLNSCHVLWIPSSTSRGGGSRIRMTENFRFFLCNVPIFTQSDVYKSDNTFIRRLLDGCVLLGDMDIVAIFRCSSSQVSSLLPTVPSGTILTVWRSPDDVPCISVGYHFIPKMMKNDEMKSVGHVWWCSYFVERSSNLQLEVNLGTVKWWCAQNGSRFLVIWMTWRPLWATAN